MKKRLLALITSSAFIATVFVNPLPANANGYLAEELVIEFDGTSGDTLCLPIYGTYDLEVDWDDANGYISESDTDSSPEDYLNFDSTTAGPWVVKIKEADGNALKRFGFDEDELKDVATSPADLWDSESDCFKKMTKVLNWGNWVSDWTLAFADQQNLTTVPNSTPGNDPTSFQSMFENAKNFTGSDADPSTLSDWDTSTVTNMKSMFEDAENFNADISGWDTSNVSRMDNMFENASVFESDISGWVTSSVTDMSDMFKEATVFDSDIGGWDVSSVVDFNDMFEKTDAFNADIGGWTIGEEDPESTLEIRMDNMFDQATAFNSDLNDWNVSNVTEMQNMFEDATVFNGDISDWDTSSVTDMKDMFKGAFDFGKEDKQDIGGWVTSSATDMSDMFKDAAYFNQDIGGWDVANVTDFSQMFYGADAFNQDIGSWSTGNVEQMQSMFEGAEAFNQYIGDWDTSNVGQGAGDSNSMDNMLAATAYTYCFPESFFPDGITLTDLNLPIGYVESECTVYVAPAPPEPSAPAPVFRPYYGPISKPLAQTEATAGEEVTVNGFRMNTVQTVTAGDQQLEVVSTTSSALVLVVPENLSGMVNLSLHWINDDNSGTYNIFEALSVSKPEVQETFEPQANENKKINAGSFKGYVSIYALGYEGQRLSAKIGNDWVIVDPIVNNQTSSLARIVDFTGAGVDINLRVFIDRELVLTMPLVTK